MNILLSLACAGLAASAYLWVATPRPSTADEAVARMSIQVSLEPMLVSVGSDNFAIGFRVELDRTWKGHVPLDAVLADAAWRLAESRPDRIREDDPVTLAARLLDTMREEDARPITALSIDRTRLSR